MDLIRIFSFLIFLKANLRVLNAELNTTSSQDLNSTKEDVNVEADVDYNDESDDSAENTRISRNKTITTPLRLGITYTWGKWEKWSKCANSCVQIKRRPCIKRIQNDTSSAPITYTYFPEVTQYYVGCQGRTKKYRLCKEEKCKSSNHLRDEQCANFNNIPYREKFYNWRGYEKEHNECELFCKPIDSDIFINMNQSVADGVPCEKPSVYYTHAYRRKAVCVEGICKPCSEGDCCKVFS